MQRQMHFFIVVDADCLSELSHENSKLFLLIEVEYNFI